MVQSICVITKNILSHDHDSFLINDKNEFSEFGFLKSNESVSGRVAKAIEDRPCPFSQTGS